MKSLSLSRGEIVIHILLEAKLNVLGIIESNLVAHALYVRYATQSATTRLTAVYLCRISKECRHTNSNTLVAHASYVRNELLPKLLPPVSQQFVCVKFRYVCMYVCMYVCNVDILVVALLV